MSTDPVCGMEVHESLAPASTQYQGVTLCFCSVRCYGKFQGNLATYIEHATAKAA